jgi:DME family drug/metabolite transporter
LIGERGEEYLGALAVLAAATVWGTLGLFLKALYAEGVSFEALVAVRAAGGCAVMVCFLSLTRQASQLRVKLGDLALLIPLGLVPVGAFYLLYFYTIRESAVGTSAILLYSSPAFVVMLAWAVLGERPAGTRLLALLLTVAGVALAVGAHEPGALAVRPLVVLAGLGAGLSYSLYSVLGKPLAGRLSPAVILTYALGWARSCSCRSPCPPLAPSLGCPSVGTPCSHRW